MSSALGLIGPLASIGGALFGGSDTAKNVPQAPPVYQPTGQSRADNFLQAGIQHQYSGSVPQADQAVQSLYNNPGAQGAIQGANVAGGLGQLAGLSQFGQGQNLTGVGNSVVPYAYSALNMGFDPQQAMYNQQFQQNTDQTRALLEARGIDSTPYGAGVEADSNRKFNTDWGFNQLARAGQGAQTANSLFGTQYNDVLGGQGLAGTAPGTYMTGSQMPYNTNQTIGQNQLAAIGAGQGIQQTPLANWMNYLGLGQQAAQVGTGQQQANLNQNQLNFNQNQLLGSQLGAGIQGLAKGWPAFSNSFGGGGGNPLPGQGSFIGPVA